MTKKKQGRQFQVGDRVYERPTRPFVLTSGANLNAAKPKVGTIVAIEQRKQRAKNSKTGFSIRSYVSVKWDIRAVAESVMESRVIHESELEKETQMLLHEID